MPFPGTSIFPAGTAPFLEDGGELPPSATTGAAVITGGDTVSLAGSIDPHDLQAHFWFEYGYTLAYGSHGGESVAGTAPVNVIQAIGGIDGAAVYHYRLVAWNAAGTTYGLDQIFTGLYGPADLSFVHEGGKGQY